MALRREFRGIYYNVGAKKSVEIKKYTSLKENRVSKSPENVIGINNMITIQCLTRYKKKWWPSFQLLIR
uniref:Uncharacterized protein n=1 Tax=Lepeophtheirus salmonis TaxID=72036 RepID=A0A0K2UU69_LEPSM